MIKMKVYCGVVVSNLSEFKGLKELKKTLRFGFLKKTARTEIGKIIRRG
jgi:hypothetical protein